jgi:peroxiredoxin
MKPFFCATYALSIALVIFGASEIKALPLALGSHLPEFSLRGTDGKTYTQTDFAQLPAVVVAFWSNTCPFAQAYEGRILALQKNFAGKNVGWILINANDAMRDPLESMDAMQKRAELQKYPFPYVKDETQQIAQRFGAERTPEVFVFDGSGIVVYEGRIDDNSEAKDVRHEDLKNALDQIFSKTAVEPAITKPFGCSIKWK